MERATSVLSIQTNQPQAQTKKQGDRFFFYTMAAVCAASVAAICLILAR